MTRPTWTPGRALAAVEAAGAMPDGAEVDRRKGDATWMERGLRMHLSISRARGPEPRGLLRALFVYPDSLAGAAWSAGGLAACVALRPVEDGAADAEGAGSMVRFVQEARGFFHDPMDLCRILLQREHVQRGHVYAWLFESTVPSRVVRALALARELGDEALTAEALALIHSGRRVQVRPDLEEDILVATRRWAATLERESGYHVEI